MPPGGASSPSVSTRPSGPGPSRRRAEGPSTRGPPKEGPGVNPGKSRTTRHTPIFPRREGPLPRTRPDLAPRTRLWRSRSRSVQHLLVDWPGPRWDPCPGPIATDTWVRPRPGCSPGRPAGKESVRHESRYLARRPDRHVGRRDLRRPRAPRLPGHLVRPLPADAPGGRAARREGLSRQTNRHRPLARVERTLQRQGRPHFHRHRLPGEGAGQDQGGPVGAPARHVLQRDQAEGRRLCPGPRRGSPGSGRARGYALRGAARGRRWSIPSPGRRSSGSRCTSPTASGASARARSSTARPRSRSSSPAPTSSG